MGRDNKSILWIAPILAALLLSGSARGAIFGHDNRQYVRAAPRSPFAAIGMVRRGLLVEHRTTGTLVGECHVLTSQHLFGMRSSPVGKRASFIGLPGSGYQVASGGTVIAAGGMEQHPAPGPNVADYANDWALLRLDDCLGTRLGFATLRSEPESVGPQSAIMSAGYPMGRSTASGLTLDPACHVTNAAASVWRTDCAAVYGDSGGPLFELTNEGSENGLIIYAIKSAGIPWRVAVPFDNDYANIATPVGQILPWIKQYLSVNSRPPVALKQAGLPARPGVRPMRTNLRLAKSGL